jgi:hypothetical protein
LRVSSEQVKYSMASRSGRIYREPFGASGVGQ